MQYAIRNTNNAFPTYRVPITTGKVLRVLSIAPAISRFAKSELIYAPTYPTPEAKFSLF